MLLFFANAFSCTPLKRQPLSKGHYLTTSALHMNKAYHPIQAFDCFF